MWCEIQYYVLKVLTCTVIYLYIFKYFVQVRDKIKYLLLILENLLELHITRTYI